MGPPSEWRAVWRADEESSPDASSERVLAAPSNPSPLAQRRRFSPTAAPDITASSAQRCFSSASVLCCCCCCLCCVRAARNSIFSRIRRVSCCCVAPMAGVEAKRAGVAPAEDDGGDGGVGVPGREVAGREAGGAWGALVTVTGPPR